MPDTIGFAIKCPAGSRSGLNRADAALSAIFAAIAVAIGIWGFAVLGHALQTAASFNLWFQADSPRVIENLTDRHSNHYRTSVHPAASILLTPIVIALHSIGIPALPACEALILTAAAVCGGGFYIALRLLGLPKLAASVFAALYLSSAAFIYWYSQIELNAVGGATIVLALLALAYGRTKSELWWVLVSAATLSITITNWSIGLAATLVRWPLKKTLAISVAALATVILLSLAQSLTFWHAAWFFRVGAVTAEARWSALSSVHEELPTDRPLMNMRSLFLTTMVAPDPVVEVQDGDKVVTNQDVPATTGTPYAIAAAIAWAALLGCGLIGAVGGLRTDLRRPVVAGLGLMLLGQMVLHSVYGNPTFLYAPHFLPLLVALAALSWFTPVRWPALGLAVMVCAAGGVSNVQTFRSAAALANQVIGQGGNAIQSAFPANDVLPAR
jgi:hypothetical protein